MTCPLSAKTYEFQTVLSHRPLCFATSCSGLPVASFQQVRELSEKGATEDVDYDVYTAYDAGGEYNVRIVLDRPAAVIQKKQFVIIFEHSSGKGSWATYRSTLEGRELKRTGQGGYRVQENGELLVDRGGGHLAFGHAKTFRALTDDRLIQGLTRKAEPTTPASESKSVEERLLELESLKEKGLISEEEYQQKRQELLESL